MDKQVTFNMEVARSIDLVRKQLEFHTSQINKLSEEVSELKIQLRNLHEFLNVPA